MSCHTRTLSSGMIEGAVGRKCTSRGTTHQERLRIGIPCPDCRVEFTAESMTAHIWRMHGTEGVSQTQHITQVFNAKFPKDMSQCKPPFPICLDSSNTWMVCRIILTASTGGGIYRSWSSTPPQFPNMRGVGFKHHLGELGTGIVSQSNSGSGVGLGSRNTTQQHRLDASLVSISVDSEPLEPVAEFPYLGRTVAYINSNWAALYQNLRKARRRWEMVRKLESKTGAVVQAWGKLYKAFV